MVDGFVVGLSIALVVILVGGVIAYFVFRKKNGTNPPGPPIPGKDYWIEKTLDPSLGTPPNLFLANFQGQCKGTTDPRCSRPNSAYNGGLPWCEPSWFAVRYVNIFDGTFGPLSSWIGPIIAGADTY